MKPNFTVLVRELFKRASKFTLACLNFLSPAESKLISDVVA